MASSEHQEGGPDAKQQRELVDITSLVEKAASSLTHQDPLLRDAATFSLQESMSALEVTDAKMDCCELPIVGGDGGDGEKTVPPRRLPTGLHHPLVSSTLPWDALTLSDARIVALEALTRLCAVLDGAGAAESTYSYLYAHDGVLADMATEIEAARLLVYKSAWEKDQGMNYDVSSSMAKLYASKVAMDVTVEAVQVHGGYGYVKEYHVERLMRDAKITQIYEGTSEVQKIVISRAVTKD